MRQLSYPIKRYELYELIESGEGSDVEFKRQFSSPEKIAKEIIAFANTKGGYLLFGVDDNGDVVGVRSEKSELDEIIHAAHYLCDPPVKIIAENVHAGYGKDIVLIRVPESANKPHTLIPFDSSGRLVRTGPKTGYVRVADKSMQASKETLGVMRGNHPDAPGLRMGIGYNERTLIEFLQKNERVTVNEYADYINISRRRASRIMINLVRAGIIFLHTGEKADYYTLVK